MHRPKQLTESSRITAQALGLLLFLLPPGFAAAQETKPISALEVKYRTRIFDNDRLAVYLLEIPPKHASLMHRHDTDILTVFVSGGETVSTIYGQPPKGDKFAVGEVRFRSAGFTHSTENVGANMFRCVILEFKSSMGSILPTKPGDSHYCNPDTPTTCVDEKYLICTPRFRTLELSVAPGAIWRNQDSANDQLLIAVSACELSGKPKGETGDLLKRKSGDVEYLAGGSAREWQNVASETAHLIVVEFR